MLTAVVGLPGSGKTMFATVEALKDPGLLVLDDYLGGGVEGARSATNRVANLIRLGRRALVNDSTLCLAEHRAGLELSLSLHSHPGGGARWLFFANSPEACRRNVERRYLDDLARGRPRAIERRDHALGLIDQLASTYWIPDGATILPVVDYSDCGRGPSPAVASAHLSHPPPSLDCR